MSQMSTLTVMADAAGLNGNGVVGAKMTKSQLNVPNGGGEKYAFDENNNKVEGKVSQDVNNNQVAGSSEQEEKIYNVLGIKFKQPLKKVNSILIPVYHLLAVYAFFNTSLDVKVLTVLWGKFSSSNLIVQFSRHTLTSKIASHQTDTDYLKPYRKANIFMANESSRHKYSYPSLTWLISVVCTRTFQSCPSTRLKQPIIKFAFLHIFQLHHTSTHTHK